MNDPSLDDDTNVPVLVFFKAKDILNEPRLRMIRRNRNYPGIHNPATDRVYIKALMRWVPSRYCTFIDFTFNEKLLVIETMHGTPLEQFDVVESVTPMVYEDNAYFFTKVRFPGADETFDVIVDYHVRPIRLISE
jgi:hypothetical protein